MKLRSLKSLFLALFGTACFLGLNFSLCGPTSPSTPPKNPKLSDFILSAMTGWNAPVDSNLYVIYNDTISDQVLTHKIKHFVDGGDFSYIQDSVIIGGKTVTTLDSGLYQSFIRSNQTDSISAIAFVLDYRTAANALATYNRFKQKVMYLGSPLTIGTNDTTVAVGRFNGSEFDSYAHFNKYFIEFHVVTFGNLFGQDSCGGITKTFINKYQSIIE